MSDTHVNAYLLELEEKKRARVALDGEIQQLEATIKSLSPDEPAEAPAEAEAEAPAEPEAEPETEKKIEVKDEDEGDADAKEKK